MPTWRCGGVNLYWQSVLSWARTRLQLRTLRPDYILRNQCICKTPVHLESCTIQPQNKVCLNVCEMWRRSPKLVPPRFFVHLWCVPWLPLSLQRSTLYTSTRTEPGPRQVCMHSRKAGHSGRISISTWKHEYWSKSLICPRPLATK